MIRRSSRRPVDLQGIVSRWWKLRKPGSGPAIADAVGADVVLRRAIQQPALSMWVGDESQRTAAQRMLLHRAHCDKAALRSDYAAAMERF